MAFNRETIAKAWVRQGGVCAHSSKRLTKSKRGENSPGGWEAHHRNPTGNGGTDTLRNCVIFSVYPINYHFQIGHGDISWDNYEPLNATEIPYAHYGARAQKVMSIVRKRTKARRQSSKKAYPSVTRLRGY